MKKIYLILLIACFATKVVSQQSKLFISEFHYDNNGVDAGEFIEVSGPAGTDLTGCSLVLYNGGGSTTNPAPVYSTTNLTGSIDNEGSGVGAVSFNYPSNGIENGSNDGIALVCGGTVIHLISYEGTFTPAAGTPAAGLTPIDVGVTQVSTTASGSSLQLRTGGWVVSTGSNTAGAYNSPLPLPVRLLFFQSETTQEGVNLSWQTSEEANNSHFEVQRSSDAQNFEGIGRVAGRGNSTETNTYTLTDATPRLGLNYYRLKQVDFDGKFEYSRVIVAQYDGNGTFRAYPNPTTDQLSIELPKNTEAALYELFDTQGRSLKRFSKREEVSLLGVPTGQYFLQVQTIEGTILKQRIIKN
jgi:Secretion system C-terminal sorting domain